MELRIKVEDERKAREAEGLVLLEIDRLSLIFSGYDKASEFSRWLYTTGQGPIKISPELFEILQRCEHWQTQSHGAFDPRVEIMSNLWAACARENRLPTPEELEASKKDVTRPFWQLDVEKRTAERLGKSPLSLNAIAKGYIIERACSKAMQEVQGLQGLLLNVGGDMRTCGVIDQIIAIGNPADGSENAEPIAYVRASNKAIATSGKTHRGFSIMEHWYSHIIDPRSGLPVDQVASATVIADRSADADALATILNVLPPAQGVRLAQSIEGLECLIVETDGRTTKSKGWDYYQVSHPRDLAIAEPQKEKPETARQANASQTWADEFELLVNFEINLAEVEEGKRYRRPYVAIWVEDKEGFPVRNLLLWVSQGGAGPWQWLPDLKRWYRSDEVRRKIDKRDMVHVLSQPTRQPGKYSVIWDGKDDRGKSLESGPYTLYIESAREHGTYQSIRRPLTLADKPFSEELKGNVEIKSASIEYRRKGASK